VFSGVVGAPAQCFPVQASSGGPYTTLATSPVTREAPYLYQDSRGNYKVFVPAVQHESSGTTWQNGETPGSSIPIRRFFIAQPTDSAEKINRALFFGFDLILTPGVYKLDRSIEVTRPDTVVVGLGFPTLIPENGNASITVASDDGVLISGIIFEAGAKNSRVLLQVGCEWRHCDGHDRHGSDPSGLYDVFFRIGGAQPGSATISLVVNSDNVIRDDIWGAPTTAPAWVGPATLPILASSSTVTA
jgi:hypothetical protein